MALFFIAINPDEKTIEEIRSFQQIMADRFESARQLKIPVHITLIPPFKKKDYEEEQLIAKLDEFGASQHQFHIETEDFGKFDKRVIYVAVRENNVLTELYKQLRIFLVDNFGDEFRPYHHTYHPHITIANRDLTEQNFEKACEYFCGQNYKSEFPVTSICLYKHDGKRWQIYKLIELNKAE